MPGVKWDIITVAGNTESQTWSLSDPGMTRVEDWMFSVYGIDASGDPLPDNPTNRALAADRWIAAQQQGLKNNVERYEEIIAAKDAAGNVPPVT